jgi:anti-sigma regulatory factor (Ser/Thr protein kinase)
MSSMRQRVAGPHEIELDIPAAHSAERLARAVLSQFARGEGVEGAEIDTLEFVASEMLSNAVDHGGGGAAMEESDLPGPVRILLTLRIEAGGWELRVADQGGGEPEDVAGLIDDCELPDLDDERGRGFFLLRQMLSGLRVEKSADKKGLTFVASRRYG